MKATAALLLANAAAKTAILEIPIIAVLQAFSVVVGAALTRFFVEPRAVDAQNFENWRHPRLSRELFYWSVLTVLITLAIRFLVGSGVHLRMTYIVVPEISPPPFHRFLKDLFFLFVFGSFLVRAALSRTVRSFVRWLMLFSVTGFVWSGIEWLFYTERLAGRWFFINLFQFAVTFFIWRLAPRKEGEMRGLLIVLVLVVIFAVLFCIDLPHIITSSIG